MRPNSKCPQLAHREAAQRILRYQRRNWWAKHESLTRGATWLVLAGLLLWGWIATYQHIETKALAIVRENAKTTVILSGQMEAR
jgi:hypothetical protein